MKRRHFLYSASSSALVAAAGSMGCDPPGRLRIEVKAPAAFDPVRWDAGPEPAANGPPPERLVFGITPFYSPERQRPMLARLQKYLEARVRIPIVTEVSPTYAACVEKLGAGAIDIAQLSPYAYVRATETITDLVPLATAIAQGTTSYASYLVVRRDAPYARITDARGARLGFTDRWSTSGYVYPASWLHDQGFDVEADFQVSWHRSHDAALGALLAGDIDIAAVSSDTLVSHRVIGVSGPVRVLAKAGRIPYDAIVVRERMPAFLRHRVRKTFLRLSVLSPEGGEVLEDYNLINGFMPVPIGHYDKVRERAGRLR